MQLKNTLFFKTTIPWINNWRLKLHSKSKEYWEEYKLDIDKYVQKIYLLHLPQSDVRKKHMKDVLSSVKTTKSTLLESTTYWEGVSDVTEFDSNIHIPEYSLNYNYSIDRDPRLIGQWHDTHGRVPTIQELEDIIVTSSHSESNIALGHASILQDIVDNDIQHALILEDDIDFCPGFSWLIENTFKQLPEDWDILYVSHQPCMNSFKSTPFSEDLFKVKSGVWWLSGVFISQRAAQKLVNNFPIIGPVDVWINHHFEDLNVFVTKMNYIIQAQGKIDSTNTHSYKKAYDIVLKNLEKKSDI